MESLHDDILRIIVDFVGFGEDPGRNVVSYQRINQRWRTLLSETTRVEVDHNRVIRVCEWMRQYPEYRTDVEQKRNAAMEWDNYRGYFIVGNVDRAMWTYYDSLLQKYFFQHSNGIFPHYRGQMYFYEFPIM